MRQRTLVDTGRARLRAGSQVLRSAAAYSRADKLPLLLNLQDQFHFAHCDLTTTRSCLCRSFPVCWGHWENQASHPWRNVIPMRLSRHAPVIKQWPCDLLYQEERGSCGSLPNMDILPAAGIELALYVKKNKKKPGWVRKKKIAVSLGALIVHC